MIDPLAKKTLHLCLDDAQDFIVMLGALTRAMQIFGTAQDKKVATAIDLLILMGAELKKT
jgi:hypothetical protein